MKVLLDTHTFLWIAAGSPIGQNALDAYLNRDNTLFFSAASYWEICIKLSLGKLQLRDGWESLLDDEMRAAGIRWLPIEKEHCLRLTSLPFHHNDPFDRILIAQAQQEGMTFLSRDANLAGYGIPVVW